MFYINDRKSDLIGKGYLLWGQHSEWTRMAFTSIIFNNPNKKESSHRLLRNPWDFACYFRGFYGEDIGYRFGCLLTEHLSLALDLVRALVKDDTDMAMRIEKNLFENADHISAFLASINPYWLFNIWRDMLYMHLDLAGEMAKQNIDGEYEQSITTYDTFELEVMDMAHLMVDGIMRQFSLY